MFLNREWVHARLQVMRRYDNVLQRCCDIEENQWSDVIVCAAERALHMALECVMDIANHIIDAFAMRDPSSYTDIATVMTEESVFPRDFSNHFMELVHFRRRLAHEYHTLNFSAVLEMAKRHRRDFHDAERHFRQFLRMEA